MPDMESFSKAVAKVVTLAFKVGVQMAVPFLVVGTLIQAGFGLLGRLMPQVQIFFMAMPLQIFLSLVILGMTLSVSMLYWLDTFHGVLTQSLVP
jgi:flagellar biosynthetic protein FliR